MSKKTPNSTLYGGCTVYLSSSQGLKKCSKDNTFVSNPVGNKNVFSIHQYR